MQHFEPSEYYGEQLKPQQWWCEATTTRSRVSACDAAAPTADVKPQTLKEGEIEGKEASIIDELEFEYGFFLI